VSSYGSTSAAIPTPPVSSDHQALLGHDYLAEEAQHQTLIESRSLPNPSRRVHCPFTYLDRSYSVKTPSCLVPRINELFKSICDRYDVAVVNREKVDQALALFKQMVGVDKMASMEESFTVWRDGLTDPKFTVTRNERSNDVKEIRVRADVIPKEKRKAQKYIREMLDACHLFLDQKDFLHRQISADLMQLDSFSGKLQLLGKSAKLTSSERKQLPKTYELARQQFARFTEILDTFYAQVFSLIMEVSTAARVLEGKVKKHSGGGPR